MQFGLIFVDILRSFFIFHLIVFLFYRPIPSTIPIQTVNFAILTTKHKHRIWRSSHPVQRFFGCNSHYFNIAYRKFGSQPVAKTITFIIYLETKVNFQVETIIILNRMTKMTHMNLSLWMARLTANPMSSKNARTLMFMYQCHLLRA